LHPATYETDGLCGMCYLDRAWPISVMWASIFSSAVKVPPLQMRGLVDMQAPFVASRIMHRIL